MRDDDLIYAPAHRLAALIAARKLSPLTLVDAVIARAEQVNPRLNCFATMLFDETRDAARRAESDVMHDRPLGPLHGVPITLKDIADAHSLAVPRFPLAAAAAPTLRGMRVGWLPRFGGTPVDADVATLTADAVRLMQADGADVTEFDNSAFDDVFDTYVVIATTAHAARLGHFVARFGERMTASLKTSIAQGAAYSAADLVRAIDRRTVLYRHVQRPFDRFDVLVTPTLTAPPQPVDAGGAINTPLYAEWARTLYPFNLTGHPAASVPCGFTGDGMPVGLQIVARWYDEQRIIDLAAFLEAAIWWSDRRPPPLPPEP